MDRKKNKIVLIYKVTSVKFDTGYGFKFVIYNNKTYLSNSEELRDGRPMYMKRVIGSFWYQKYSVKPRITFFY